MRHFAWHWLAVSSLFLGSLARAETRPQYGGTLRVMMRTAPATLDPADSRVPDSFARRSVSALLFDTLVTMDDVPGLRGAEDSTMVLMPSRGALVLVGRNQEEVIVHPFDLDNLLEKLGRDYLVVTSEPPTELFTGDKL